MVELLSQAGQPASQVAARRPRLASDQRRTFVDRVTVLIVQRDDRSLLATESSIGPIEVQVRFSWRWAGDRLGQPEPGKQAPPGPDSAANANPAQPRRSLRWIAEGRPGSPGQLHRFLNGVLCVLRVAQDRVRNGKEPAALSMNRCLKRRDVARRLLEGHDHETIESANGRLVYVRRDDIVTVVLAQDGSGRRHRATAWAPSTPRKEER